MKKSFAIAVAVALVVGITALAYGAAPEKATGGVETGHADAWRFSFNAHEGPATDGTDGKGQLSITSNIEARTLHCVVKYVMVDPANDDAWFAAECTKDSVSPGQVGKYIFIKVHDGGTPGRNGDQLGWAWYPTAALAQAQVTGNGTPPMYFITKGNLVVH